MNSSRNGKEPLNKSTTETSHSTARSEHSITPSQATRDATAPGGGDQSASQKSGGGVLDWTAESKKRMSALEKTVPLKEGDKVGLILLDHGKSALQISSNRHQQESLYSP